MVVSVFLFFFKQKTAYEMRISDWSSDVCSSDLAGFRLNAPDVRTAPFLLDDKRVEVELHGPGAEEPAPAMLVAEGGSVWQLAPWRADASAGGVAGDGAILSPMPGKVIAVDVAAGDKVTKGQKLLTLEAMKMEHSLTAPFDGIVAEPNAQPCAQGPVAIWKKRR